MDTIIDIVTWPFRHWIISGIVIFFVWGSIVNGKNEAERRRREEEEAEERRKRFWSCDECGKEWSIVKGRTEEVDRYPTYKEVKETSANGKVKTRQVKVFKVKEVTHYKCKSCNAGFTTTNTRELK